MFLLSFGFAAFLLGHAFTFFGARHNCRLISLSTGFFLSLLAHNQTEDSLITVSVFAVGYYITIRFLKKWHLAMVGVACGYLIATYTWTILIGEFVEQSVI